MLVFSKPERVLLCSLKVNPCVLSGVFSVKIFPYGPLPWKWSHALYLFCLRKPANGKKERTIGQNAI